ncbi:type II toxin-antitoxin system PemK/MazF family toxin [Limnovirga soli]|uniref:Type II toxin-antitoxin system PemK/MazF family toxin n=1 Tax=Limnovirga soli TaxID=2656915 RepID=A0A8J8FGA9_9BACT|nr:type II toxin-antitoxin system PemK/MazF family toxin [Limnovirga soli]NNV57373.1 hypothetical protein [Limnovirga soli]
MPYNQRDVVYLTDPVSSPKGQKITHPVLIISKNKSSGYENHYTGVMLSSTLHKDRYTFSCDDTMFEGSLKPNSQIRTYLIYSFHESDINMVCNKMKPFHFKLLLEEIKNTIFIFE